MNAKENNLLLILGNLSLTLGKKELLDIAALINDTLGNENPDSQTNTSADSSGVTENQYPKNTDFTYEYITEQEMSRRVKLCPKTLCDLRKRKEISYHKMGGQIRYSPEDIKKFHEKTFNPSKKDENRYSKTKSRKIA